MNGPVQRRCLSGVDAAFLYLERKELPLHIAGVFIFEEPLPFQEFVSRIDSKLHLIPRYLQVPVPAPFHLGHPVWEYARKFDIHNHIFEVSLEPPGGEAELEAFASRLLSEPMDRNKPLWDLHVIKGLRDGGGALIVRIHHSLADGVSGLALVHLMLEQTPVSAPVRGRRRRRPPRPAPEYTLQDALRNAILGTLENLLASETALIDFAEAFSKGQLKDSLERLLGLLPELAAPVERLPFNKPCREGRLFCWTQIDLNAAKAVCDALGGTINDVLLTVFTRAIARYTKLHGETVSRRSVRIVCPVDTRNGEGGASLGNRITFMPVVLPLDAPTPAAHLQAVAARTEIMKGARAADVVSLLATWIGAAPPALQKMFWNGIPLVTLPVPLFNTICTNMRGSAVPLYACGKRLLAGYPQVPTGYDLGVNCAIQSYDGKLCFGLTADAHACPDVRKLRDYLGVSFRELCRAAGVRTARPRARAKPAVHLMPREEVKAAAAHTPVDPPAAAFPEIPKPLAMATAQGD